MQGFSFSISTKATPYYELPMTLSFKAMKQKMYRQIHCMECGMPFCEISDKIVSISDSINPIENLTPDKIGVVATSCTRGSCRQRYRFEFAI